ncbi:MAG: DUF3127 domain-containing protein [Muribaculaceae bacterium]|nr:DUF3127 domain-containing protein [Muribaculaceae bacterium]
MEIEGIIISDLGVTEGVSKAGRNWKKKEYVLETAGVYPRKVKFTVFGDKADTLTFKVGTSYQVSVDAESREFNGRWYTDLTAYASHEIQAGQSAAQQAPMGASEPAPAFGQPASPMSPDPLGMGSDNTDDLPF